MASLKTQDKVPCGCGAVQEGVKSYFYKESGYRVTVCDNCAEQNGLTDKSKFDSVDYKSLGEQQNITPAPNGGNK